MSRFFQAAFTSNNPAALLRTAEAVRSRFLRRHRAPLTLIVGAVDGRALITADDYDAVAGLASLFASGETVEVS